MYQPSITSIRIATTDLFWVPLPFTFNTRGTAFNEYSVFIDHLEYVFALSNNRLKEPTESCFNWTAPPVLSRY